MTHRVCSSLFAWVAAQGARSTRLEPATWVIGREGVSHPMLFTNYCLVSPRVLPALLPTLETMSYEQSGKIPYWNVPLSLGSFVVHW